MVSTSAAALPTRRISYYRLMGFARCRNEGAVFQLDMSSCNKMSELRECFTRQRRMTQSTPVSPVPNSTVYNLLFGSKNRAQLHQPSTEELQVVYPLYQ